MEELRYEDPIVHPNGGESMEHKDYMALGRDVHALLREHFFSSTQLSPSTFTSNPFDSGNGSFYFQHRFEPGFDGRRGVEEFVPQLSSLRTTFVPNNLDAGGAVIFALDAIYKKGGLIRNELKSRYPNLATVEVKLSEDSRSLRVVCSLESNLPVPAEADSGDVKSISVDIQRTVQEAGQLQQ